jgi:hypothetical protein
MSPNLGWMLGVIGVSLVGLLVLWGVWRLRVIRRQVRELTQRMENLFLYDQYHTVALQNWTRAEQATEAEEWEVAEEAWRSTVQCLEKAQNLDLQGVASSALEEELKRARQRLEEVQRRKREAGEGTPSPSPPLAP